MPFIAGIQMSEDSFIKDIYPDLKKNQKSSIMMVFLDSGNISPYEFDPQNIFLPNFGGVFTGFLKEFSKYHGIKKSKHFDLEKHKIDSKKEILKIKMRSKPDKKPTKNKSKVKHQTFDQQVSSISLLQST